MADENIDDSTSENNQESNEEIVNDIETLPSEEEEVSEGEPKATEESKSDEKDEKIQKLERTNRTLNRKYGKATDDINKLRDIQSKKAPVQAEPLTEEEKKDKQAKEYIDKRVEKGIKEEKEKEQKALDTFVAEMKEDLDNVLYENEDLTEKQILDTVEDYAKNEIKLTPTQAAVLIKDGYKKEKAPDKPKPKVPAPKRGSGEVSQDTPNKESDKKLTYHEKFAQIIREGKKTLQK